MSVEGREPSVLEFCVVGCAGEGYHVADVGHTGDEEYETFES